MRWRGIGGVWRVLLCVLLALLSVPIVAGDDPAPAPQTKVICHCANCQHGATCCCRLSASTTPAICARCDSPTNRAQTIALNSVWLLAPAGFVYVFAAQFPRQWIRRARQLSSHPPFHIWPPPPRLA